MQVYITDDAWKFIIIYVILKIAQLKPQTV